MSVDSHPEHSPEYLSLAQAARRIPTAGGRPPSTQSLWRWATSGCRGVKLETLRFGRRVIVTPAALDKFARELAAAWAQPDAPKPGTRAAKAPTRHRTPAQREKAIQAATARLRDRGVMS